MTQPTFQELLTSQEARDRSNWFHPREGGGSHWMNRYGDIFSLNTTDLDIVRQAIWQGWLTEAAPPPEPRVFKRVEYRPVLKGEGLNHPSVFQTKEEAENFGKIVGGMIACVRVEITATEGQFDD
jgi:hypothetical protein